MMGHAASLFYNTTPDRQSLHSRVTPTKEQREFLQEHWNALAEYAKERLTELSGYSISTWIQGSYKFGTMIRPLSLSEEFDVDLGVYFEWTADGAAEPAPTQLKAWVQRALVDYLNGCEEATGVEEPPKERCARISYDKQFHIDVPAYHLQTATDWRRLATQTKGWEDSDPKALYVWFKTRVENPERDQVRRLVRYLKAWAAVAFNGNEAARPTSVLLTVLATVAYSEARCTDLNLDDEDALGAVALKVLDRLRKDRRVLNPATATKEDLNRIPAAEFDICLRKLEEVVDAARRAADANDEAAAALVWADIFSYVFPLPESESVEIVDMAKNTALMAVPNIRIDVTDRKSGRVLGSYTNEVSSVPKDCNLRFVITNPEVVPPFATIAWVVRNEGTEAEAVGDLGHRSIAADGLTAEEHTKYAGRHFMDCTIKCNGLVWAVRRVPVNIRDVAYPSRNPPRPAYVKLRSLFKRR
jgi:hypothetical protein